LADVWKKFSILLYPFNLTVPRGQVYKFWLFFTSSLAGYFQVI
jgi:hypothetical protein